MPNFKVLQNIELNGKLYVPQSDDAPEQAPSACHGRPIPVDASGIIELTYELACEMKHDQIEPIAAKPQSRAK